MERIGGMTHVEQPPAQATRVLCDPGYAGKTHMHAARDIQPRFQGFNDVATPRLGKHASGIDGPDDEGSGTCARRSGNR